MKNYFRIPNSNSFSNFQQENSRVVKGLGVISYTTLLASSNVDLEQTMVLVNKTAAERNNYYNEARNSLNGQIQISKNNDSLQNVNPDAMIKIRDIQASSTISQNTAGGITSR